MTSTKYYVPWHLWLIDYSRILILVSVSTKKTSAYTLSKRTGTKESSHKCMMFGDVFLPKKKLYLIHSDKACVPKV